MKRFMFVGALTLSLGVTAPGAERTLDAKATTNLQEINAATPVNPNATQKTRDLLNLLSGMTNRTSNRIVIGEWMGFISQTNGWTTYYDAVYSQTGKHLGLVGLDIEDGWGSGDVTFSQAGINKCLAHWNQGGLITINWHPHNIWNDGSVQDLTGSGGTAMEQLITPGSAVYSKYMAKLDKVAAGLKQFQDSGAVILWRPFHEMNGNWFWWGNNNSSVSYIKVWQHMYNYFTNTKGLNNLLWVYAPNEGSGAYLNTYPGDSYVDICGMDYYPSTQTFGTLAVYGALKAKGKVMAFTEYGYRGTGQVDNINVISSIRNNNPLCTYLMYWNDDSDRKYSMTSNVNTTDLMNDPWSIDRSEVWTGSTSMASESAITPPGGVVSGAP